MDDALRMIDVENAVEEDAVEDEAVEEDAVEDEAVEDEAVEEDAVEENVVDSLSDDSDSDDSLSDDSDSDSDSDFSTDWIIESGSLTRCLFESIAAEILRSNSILIVRSADLEPIDPRKYIGATFLQRIPTFDEINRLKKHTQIDIDDEILGKFLKLHKSFDPKKTVYEFVGQIVLRIDDRIIISTPNGDRVSVRCSRPIISFIPRAIPKNIFRLVIRRDGTTFRKNILSTPTRDEYHTDFLSTDVPGKSKSGSLRILHPFHLPDIDNPILSVCICVFALDQVYG